MYTSITIVGTSTRGLFQSSGRQFMDAALVHDYCTKFSSSAFNVGTSIITSISFLQRWNINDYFNFNFTLVWLHSGAYVRFLGAHNGYGYSFGGGFLYMYGEGEDSEFCNLLQPFGGDYLSHTL